jgi:poly(A) polymerase Pap1
MAVTPEMITQVRYEVQDIDLAFPLLDDATYTYILTKNNESINRSAVDAARMILMQLSIRSNDSTVDIFSVKGSKAAAAYKEALQMFLKNPQLNPVYNSVTAYAGGVSISDMQANVDNLDNNAVVSPVDLGSNGTSSTDFFSVN